jgi:hypothetical protein
MSDFEHIKLETQWKELIKSISVNFGEINDLKDVIFLIGVQELGFGFKNFTKSEKIDVMHIGVCKLLSHYDYYKFEGLDKEGWPHYIPLSTIPEFSENKRENLLKRSILAYFDAR